MWLMIFWPLSSPNFLLSRAYSHMTVSVTRSAAAVVCACSNAPIQPSEGTMLATKRAPRRP